MSGETRSPRTNIYVLQDGGDFYVHLMNGPTHVVHSPIKLVNDSDMTNARKARAWFKRQALRNNCLIRWEH